MKLCVLLLVVCALVASSMSDDVTPKSTAKRSIFKKLKTKYGAVIQKLLVQLKAIAKEVLTAAAKEALRAGTEKLLELLKEQGLNTLIDGLLTKRDISIDDVLTKANDLVKQLEEGIKEQAKKADATIAAGLAKLKAVISKVNKSKVKEDLEALENEVKILVDLIKSLLQVEVDKLLCKYGGLCGGELTEKVKRDIDYPNIIEGDWREKIAAIKVAGNAIGDLVKIELNNIACQAGGLCGDKAPFKITWADLYSKRDADEHALIGSLKAIIQDKYNTLISKFGMTREEVIKELKAAAYKGAKSAVMTMIAEKILQQIVGAVGK